METNRFAKFILSQSEGLTTSKSTGFTLLETVIATTVLGVILASVLSSLVNIQTCYEKQDRVITLETKADLVSNSVTEYLGECRVVSAPVSTSGHTEIAFQVPVAISDSYCDANGNIYWGARGQPGWKFVFRFNPNGTVLDETTSLIDYNRDGNLQDRFVQGNIQFLLKDNLDNVVASSLIGSNIILRESPLDGDVNGDGIPDPLFLMVNGSGQEDILTGNQLIVNLWLADPASHGTTYIVNRITKKRLWNYRLP